MASHRSKIMLQLVQQQQFQEEQQLKDVQQFDYYNIQQSEQNDNIVQG